LPETNVQNKKKKSGWKKSEKKNHNPETMGRRKKTEGKRTLKKKGMDGVTPKRGGEGKSINILRGKGGNSAKSRKLSTYERASYSSSHGGNPEEETEQMICPEKQSNRGGGDPTEPWRRRQYRAKNHFQGGGEKEGTAEQKRNKG